MKLRWRDLLRDLPRLSGSWLVGAALAAALVVGGRALWERGFSLNVALPVKVVEAPIAIPVTPIPVPTTTTLPAIHHHPKVEKIEPPVEEEKNPFKRAWNAVTGIFK